MHRMCGIFILRFFFQAEDGIRDLTVTGVQTCALPILEKQVPPDLDVHIILDNYSTHKSATVQRWLKSRKHRHFYFHFTPTSSSWLNQEIGRASCRERV